MGPHLVEDTTLLFKIMQTVTQTPTQTLAIRIQSQVTQRTEKQSWLGLISSHLMRWRSSILVESTLLYHNSTTNPGKIVSYFDSIYFLAWSAKKQTFLNQSQTLMFYCLAKEQFCLLFFHILHGKKNLRGFTRRQFVNLDVCMMGKIREVWPNLEIRNENIPKTSKKFILE